MSIYDRRKLHLALAVLTEGHRAPVSRALRRAASEIHHDSWSWISEPTVQGLGVGWRDHEKRTDGLCIKVYVNRKQADSALSFPAPATVSIPGFERAVPIDVQAIGDVKIRASARARIGPGAPIGLEDPREGTGTFGCIVRKRGDRDTLYLLSNCHVIARDGWAPLGTTNVLSPSGELGGTVDNDLVGILAETSKPIFSERRYDNRIDAAIARITDPERVSSMMNDIGPIRGVASSISPLASVRMAGAGSMLAGSTNSRGVVRDTDFRLGVPYRDGSGRMRRAGFAEQVLCSDFSEPSDSGAIVLNNRNEVVGLHFASAEVGGVEHSVFNRIDHVLNELDLEIVTDFPGRSRLVPSDDEEPAPEPADRRHVLVSPSIPGLQRLTRPHRFRGSVEWQLTPDGLEVDGSIAGTPGQLVTVPMVWNRFREPILQQSNELEIPVELIVATICTESRGIPLRCARSPGSFRTSTRRTRCLRGSCTPFSRRPGTCFPTMTCQGNGCSGRPTPFVRGRCISSSKAD